MFANDQHNTTRLRLLDCLSQWVSTTTGPEQIQEWVVAQRSEVLRTLRQPQSTEIPVLLAIAQTKGGMDYFKDW